MMRGPLIYALEAADNQGRALDVVLPPDAELRAEFRADLLGGLTVLRGPARLLDGSEIELLAIPYHAWDNRSHGEMTIWIPQSVGPAVQQQRDRLRRFRPGQANTNG